MLTLEAQVRRNKFVRSIGCKTMLRSEFMTGTSSASRIAENTNLKRSAEHLLELGTPSLPTVHTPQLGAPS